MARTPEHQAAEKRGGRGGRLPWRLLGLVLFAYLAWRLDWSRMGRLLERVEWGWFAAAGLCSPPLMWLKAQRWRWLCALQGVELARAEAFAYYLASSYLAFITPGRLGELAKVAYLKAKGVGASLALSGVLADRLLDLYLLVLSALVGAGWYGPWPGVEPWARAALGLALAAAPALWLLDRRYRLPERLYARLARRRLPAWAAGGLEGFTRGCRALLTPALAGAGLLTLAAYALFFLQCWFLARAVGLPLRPWEVVPLMALVNLASYLPVSVSGVGTREALLWAILSPRGASLETVMAFGLAVLCATYLVSGLMGLAASWIHPLELGWLRRPAEGSPASSSAAAASADNHACTPRPRRRGE